MIKKAVKYFLIICLVCGVANAITGGGNNTNAPAPATAKTAAPAPQKQYYAVDANTMMTDLARNAAAAQKKYKGQPLAVTGRIGVIDSNGSYILIQSDDPYAITGIICNVGNKEQENFILNVQVGQYVRAYGEITDVGEVMGYAMKVDKFES